MGVKLSQRMYTEKPHLYTHTLALQAQQVSALFPILFPYTLTGQSSALFITAKAPSVLILLSCPVWVQQC